MKRFAALMIILISMGACTKKDKNAISTDSPFQFTYDASLSQGDVIAKVGNEEITLSQLYSPSPALQDLEDRMNKIILVNVYDKALAQAGEGTVKVVYGFAEPKDDYKKLLSKNLNKNVEVSFDPAMKNAVAQLNDKTWTQDELAGQDMLLSRLMADSFRQKIMVLDGVISRRKILQASKEANTPMEQYIQHEVMKGIAEPTEADLATFAKNNNIYESELTPEMKAQVLDAMKARKRDTVISEYVAKNLIKEPIRVGFKKAQLHMDGTEINSEMVPHKGQGPIEIVIFSNIQCEACKDLTNSLSTFVSEDSKYFLLKYIFNFPDSNSEERMLAEASLCLRAQSEKLFWQFPSLVKRGEESVEESINNAVKASPADFEKFRTCFLAREFKPAIDAHLEGTKTLGFHKPPVAVVNGIVYESPNVEELMDKALAVKAEKGLGFNLWYKLKKMFSN